MVIDSNVSVSGGTNYSGGYVDFALTNGLAEDDLNLTNDGNISTANGQLSIVDGTVYLGNGSDAAVVGSVDATYNGQDGQKLRINFSNEFENGDFSDGTSGSTVITGWTAINQQVKFGTDTIAGLPTPTDTVWPTNWGGTYTDQHTPSRLGTLQTVLSSVQNDGSGLSVQMSSSGMTTLAGYDIVRGPYIYSNGAVSLSAGDTVSFEWQAQGGGDAYDVYGYIVDVNTGHIETILNETGSSTSASTTWATESVTVSQAGQYRFVFVSGTYDYSGGRAAGAQLYIDDVTVTQAVVPPGVSDAHVTEIASRVTYENSSQNPDTTTRNYSITAVNASGGTGTATSSIAVTAVDDAPVIADTSADAQWTEDGGAVAVAPNLTISDVDGGNIGGAVICIENLFAGDTLDFSNQNGIAGTYNGTTGTLTLTGSASVEAYQAALRSITFSSSQNEPDTTARSITMTLGNSLYSNETGHYYEYVDTSLTWEQAKAAAEASTLYGLQGYLATVTSAEENAVITEKLQADAWIGASDAESEGTWKWVTGPEAGTTLADAGYANWNSGEPNDSGGNEDAGEIYSTNNGLWNDLPANSGTLGYVAEYGGMAGDPALHLSLTRTVQISAVNDAPVLDNSGAMTLTAVTEDATSPAGNTVAAIIASAGGNRITDADSGAAEGVALTGLTGDGTWQYNTGGGWNNVGSVSSTTALLLTDAASLRFVPAAGNNNAQTATVTFRAWDQSSGVQGSKVNVSTNGGTTAYSTATETASVSVTAVNDAPVLDNSSAMTLTAVTEDTTAPAGDTVAAILASAGGNRITDADSGAAEGVALTGPDR